VRSYLPDVADASRTAESADAGTVVVRAAGLRVRGGPTAVPAGAAPSQGDLAVFCRPVVTAPAVVRRDGRVLAGGWLPDLVRLGELERHLGDGVIEELVDTAIAKGRLKARQRRRIMSYPLVIRLMLAMALMPDASYCESQARLAGLLADIPFVLEWHVPTEKVVTNWRMPVPAEVPRTTGLTATGSGGASGHPPSARAVSCLPGPRCTLRRGVARRTVSARFAGGAPARPQSPGVPAPPWPRSRAPGPTALLALRRSRPPRG
jgi:Insertion element 4 transposase N-terminal